MKLASKIGLSFLAASLLSLAVALGFVYKSTKENLSRSIAANLQLSVRARARHIETYLRMLRSSVVQASNSAALTKLLSTSQQDPAYRETFESAKKLLKSKAKADTSIYEYMLLDASGQVVAATDDSDIGQDRSAGATFLEGRKGLYIKDAYLSHKKKQPLMTLAMPLLKDNGGSFLGMLVARVKLDELDNIVEDNTGLGKLAETYIVNKSGYMITSCRFFEDAFLKQKIDILNTDPTPGKMHIVLDCRGTPVAREYETIPEMQWKVVSEIDKEEAFAPLDKMRRFFLWVFLFSSGLAWLLGQIMGKILARPLRRLRQGAEIVGGGNLDNRVSTDSRDEVGQLSRAFDAMTANLKKTTISIENLNEEIARRRQAEDRTNKQALELDTALKEALRSREILTSMLEDNNQIRERLEKSIEELKSSQSMLAQSEKLASLGRLVSEIAHEVNNPLMIISGNAQLSMMTDSSSPEIAKNLRVIMDECQRAKGIMQRLLKFSKPSKGQTKPVDIHRSIESVVAILEHQLGLINIEVKRNFVEAIPPIPMDEQAMHEVFMNFINNAADAMPKGGSITISTSLEGDFVKIDFKDTGFGMNEEVKQKMLEPFFTTKEKGTGLGLAVCYGIIKAHSGELRFESEPNKGTTATLLLPLGGGKT